MKKISILLAVFLCFSSLVSAKTSAERNNIVEKTSDGRVKPIDNPEVLSDKELDDVMIAIGYPEDFFSKLSREEKIKNAKDGGKAVKLSIKNVKKYYTSLSGESTEYTKENINKIKKLKLKDIEVYKKKTGRSLSIMQLGSNQPFTFRQSSNRVKSVTAAYLPPEEETVDGDLTLGTYATYLGKWGTNLEYKYTSTAYWSDKPFMTITDGFATMFDINATPISNTFDSGYNFGLNIPDGYGGWILKTSSGKLEPDADSLGIYGHGVKWDLAEADWQFAYMDRKISVSQSKIGSRALIQTKYRHTYTNLDGKFGISIGPASITFSDSSGEDYEVEYGFDYGDVTQGGYVYGWNQLDDGKWIYIDHDGTAHRGWLSTGGKWYYFDPTIMVTGWKLVGGKWYYFNSSGQMVTGWLKLGETWYYMNSSGAMVTGWLKLGETWYYFSSSGSMATGWKSIGGYWYYFYSNGSMAYNTQIDGYNLGSDGKML
ncbi:hypothetical protein ABES03_21885 [Neobacillus rhizosphaerae]|uniref:N-acetylmuramoyl-L-alanine amidase family protein n=1 Tax=Neobacillus rhizosphaerae TaxID=2880965 RepID=UPI003D2C13FB